VNIEYSQGLSALVAFDVDATAISQFDTGAPSGAQTQLMVNTTDDSRTIGTGTIGYQRLFNGFLGTESQGYFYIMINNNWNVTGLTGNTRLNLNYNHNAVYNLSITRWYGSGSWLSDGQMAFGGYGENLHGAYYTKNSAVIVHNQYSAEKPSGLGIQGIVNKTSISNVIYPTRAFIVDGITGTTITSESTISSINLPFTVINPTIKICVFAADGMWYNTTRLFNETVIPTPTVTQTPTIPVGYVRTNVAVWDRSGNLINGANIDVYDIENTSWTNTTHSTGGRGHIDTLPNHHIDIYGSYDIFANEYQPNQLLNQEVGSVTGEGYTYTLTLFPYESVAPVGYTSLYVEVKDATSHNYLNYVVVKATLPNGTVYSQNTADAGSAIFIVPNNTVINCAATLTGFLPGSVVVNSGPGKVYTATIELSRQLTATPTPWIKPTLTTQPAITRNQTTGNYTGFWSPFYNGLTGMGASNGELGLLMTMFLVIFGLIGGAIVSHGNGRVASACGSAGFIFACGFSWIPLWLILAGIAWMLGSFFLFRE
jgi:hypothetical protein